MARGSSTEGHASSLDCLHPFWLLLVTVSITLIGIAQPSAISALYYVKSRSLPYTCQRPSGICLTFSGPQSFDGG